MRKLASIVLGVALVVGIFRGGSSYLYCAMMGEVVSAHCCQHDSSPDSIVSPDCCDLGEIAPLPAGAPQLPSADVPSAPLREYATVAFATPPGEVLAPRRHDRARAGRPPPRSAARARLMVFLI